MDFSLLLRLWFVVVSSSFLASESFVALPCSCLGVRLKFRNEVQNLFYFDSAKQMFVDRKQEIDKCRVHSMKWHEHTKRINKYQSKLDNASSRECHVCQKKNEKKKSWNSIIELCSMKRQMIEMWWKKRNRIHYYLITHFYLFASNIEMNDLSSMKRNEKEKKPNAKNEKIE